MKIKYGILFFVFVLLSFTKAISQDITNYNLYIQNPILYNPAYTFDESKLSAYGNSHLQWIGFEGAPKVFTFGVQTSLVENMGFGLSGFQSRQGLNTQTNINLSYAYRVSIQDDHTIWNASLATQ